MVKSVLGPDRYQDGHTRKSVATWTTELQRTSYKPIWWPFTQGYDVNLFKLLLKDAIRILAITFSVERIFTRFIQRILLYILCKHNKQIQTEIKGNLTIRICRKKEIPRVENKRKIGPPQGVRLKRISKRWTPYTMILRLMKNLKGTPYTKRSKI